MTGSIDILPPYPDDLGGDCIKARTELADRFSDFSMKSKAGLSDAVARELRGWLNAPEFESTCYAAEVDYRMMTAIFERQILLGQNRKRGTTATVIPFPKQE